MDRNLTASRLREVAHYNPDTGVFVSKVARGKIRAYAMAAVRYRGEFARMD